MITAEELRSILRYDPEAGLFYWLVALRPRDRVGALAGGDNKAGYYKIGIRRRRYYAHHLAYLYMTGVWPDQLIDHADRNPSNNKWNNLRRCDKKLNAANMKRPKNNTSGFKGVIWAKRERKWVAQIHTGGRHIGLGYFEQLEDAKLAYERAATKFFGEFARIG